MRLRSRLERLDARINGAPFGIFVVVLAAVAALKSGLYFGHNFPSEALVDESVRPQGATVLLDVSLATALALGLDSRPKYEIFALGLAMFAMLTAAVLLAKNLPGGTARVATAFVLLGPIGAMILRHFGRYDTYFLIGAVVLALGWKGRWWILLPAGALMAAGNPGQGLSASFALLALTLVPAFRHWRRAAAAGIAMSTVWLIIVTSIGERYGIDGQLRTLPNSALQSLMFFLETFPLISYSVYGSSWLVVGFLFFQAKRRHLVWLLVAFLIIPFGWMAITWDGTRVGVGVSAMVILAGLVVVVPRWLAWAQTRDIPGAVAGLVLVAFLFPTMEVSWGEVRVPWQWIVEEIAFWWVILQG